MPTTAATAMTRHDRGSTWTSASPARALAVALVLMTAPSALATYSVVVADSSTKEVGWASVTCVESSDLMAVGPVIVVGAGAGMCGGRADVDGTRRPVIFREFQLGTPPSQILQMLSVLPGHQWRQYGMADTEARTQFWAPTGIMPWSGGIVGQQGTLVYSIQGGFLTGSCVAPAIEQALLSTSGQLPEKLMAAMVAGALAGGDGRCSCSFEDPTSCGCPPPLYGKPGHIAGMILARVGDTDDSTCDLGGCADGSYYMRLNVPFQVAGDPDPVAQLQELFSAWRDGLVGRPDSIESTAAFLPSTFPADGSTSGSMLITLLDWQGQAITAPVTSVIVTHAPGSAGITTIGAVTDNGNGTFSVALTAGTTEGVDRFSVVVDVGVGTVTLAPPPALESVMPFNVTAGKGPHSDVSHDSHVKAFRVDGAPVGPLDFVAFTVGGYGVNTAGADLAGDGVDDVLTGQGPGPLLPPVCRAYTRAGAPLQGADFAAYGASGYGLNVASGDVDGDAFDEVLTGPGEGEVYGPQVRAFDYDDSGGITPIQGINYFAYGTLTGGVNVTGVSFDDDSYSELTTGAGPGRVFGPHVRGWNFDGLTLAAVAKVSFFAYGTLQYGVNIGGGDIDRDGFDEIVTGAGPGAVFASQVRGFDVDGGTTTALAEVNFIAYSEGRYGSNVAVGDIDSDRFSEIATGQGPEASGSATLRGWNYDGSSIQPLSGLDLVVFPGFYYGLSVGVGRFGY